MVKVGKQIMLVVGEASGDTLGAELVKALLKRDPTLRIFGVAGEHLQRTKFEALFSVSKLSGMGLIELVGNLRDIWRAYHLLKSTLRERKPDLLVLIDFPEFNLRLAKTAKSLGIPVLYYVSPQVWAWRRSRVRQIARRVDQMAVIFPFEVPFYEAYGVKVVFVGHPLLEIVQAKEGRETALARLGLDPNKPTVALLPGSRRQELLYHLPVLLEAAERLRQEREVQFICVKAGTIDRAEIEEILRRGQLRIPIVEEHRYDAVNAADLVWTASGTATLETALLLKPMIIVYRVSWLTYCLARLLVSVRHIGIVNIIAGEKIAPELVQSDLQPERVVQESRSILESRQIQEAITNKLIRLKENLGAPGASNRVADIAVSMLG
ncbi:MAG: lipid-A-disaccharide synthase [Candidatus Binatia bacterium]